MLKKEIWKEYPLNFEFEGNYKIEVSNKGQIKTYNGFHPDGKIISGSLQGGFPIVRIKLFKKRTDADSSKLLNLQNQIDELNTEIKSLGASKNLLEKKLQLRKLRDELIQKRKKHNQRIDKKRCINVAILNHKAVAELFLEKPEDKDKKFIIHKDFDKLNNSSENLSWASREELNERVNKHPKNILKKFQQQFMDHKPNVRATKLSENEVLRIKLRLKKGDSLRKLAQQFGVSDMQIHRIKTGENWSHVKLIEEILEENK